MPRGNGQFQFHLAALGISQFHQFQSGPGSLSKPIPEDEAHDNSNCGSWLGIPNETHSNSSGAYPIHRLSQFPPIPQFHCLAVASKPKPIPFYPIQVSQINSLWLVSLWRLQYKILVYFRPCSRSSLLSSATHWSACIAIGSHWFALRSYQSKLDITIPSQFQSIPNSRPIPEIPPFQRFQLSSLRFSQGVNR